MENESACGFEIHTSFVQNSGERYQRISLDLSEAMSANQPDSFFAKQTSTEDQLYLSDTNHEELTYVEGAKPGISLDLMPVPEHLRKIYGKFSDDPETRKKEIEALKERLTKVEQYL